MSAKDFFAAMTSFDDAKREFEAARVLLDTVREIANPEKLARLDGRIATCSGAIGYAESGVSKIALIASAVRQGTKIEAPKNVQIFAGKTVRGAAIALAGVTYEIRAFVEQTRNPDAPGMAPAMIAASMLAGLGALESLF